MPEYKLWFEAARNQSRGYEGRHAAAARTRRPTTPSEAPLKTDSASLGAWLEAE